MALTNKLTAIADVIREKTGGTEPLTLDQMAVEIAGIQVGGGSGGDNIAEILSRKITEYRNDKVTYLGYGAFYNCKSLTALHLPSINAKPDQNSVRGCVALKVVDFGLCPNLGENTFYGDTSLNTLILRKSNGVCALPNTSTFNNVGAITVYVPHALIEAYQTATNWSSRYSAGTANFVALEGSEYE